MRSDAEQVTLDYVDAVHQRVRQPMQPPGFTPDWADRPLPHTHHPGAERIALPFPADLAPPFPADRAMRTGTGQGVLGLDELAADLQAAIGIAARRCHVDWDTAVEEMTSPRSARWGRGSASGGGTYPLEVYWSAGPSAPVPAGIYHYATGLHAMERLSSQDPTATVHAALGPGAADLGDQFLLCTVRLWKNSFKYHNLAYHLATLDLGAFTGSWGLLCRDRDIAHHRRLWFDESALNGLLGLDPDQESVHAVLPLPWGTSRRWTAPTAPVPGAARPPHHERSRTVRDFPLARAVLRATADAPVTAPVAAPAHTSRMTDPSDSTRHVPLPRRAHPLLAGRAAETLARRTSAFGRFDGARPLEADLLGAVIHEALTTDPAPSANGEPVGLTGIHVVARRVTGLEPALYAYHGGDRHTLTRAPGDGLSAVTQELYGMDNYAVSHAAAMLVLDWHPEQAVSTYGPRAYRAANVEAGAVVQRAHLAATALGLASGIVLGLDAVALDEALGLPGKGRRSQVYLFLGHPQAGAAALDGRLR
ncbi:nitroreductase family protein [Streptomyces sp. NPDC000410]|uniref:nitroreductase family protein n=1 Tax=Streptomyces sp. NPDC000410 TaxID=3154254 RepID=UPI00332F0952